MRATDREIRERAKRLCVCRIGKIGQGLDSEISLALREPGSVLKAAGRFNRPGDGLEVVEAAFFDRGAQPRDFVRRGVVERVDHRQRRLALGEVVAEVFAEFLGVGAVIEHVVHQLERGAEVPAAICAPASNSRAVLR